MKNAILSATLNLYATTKKSPCAQSTVELTVMIILGLVATTVMGPYVVRSINAYMRSWELQAEQGQTGVNIGGLPWVEPPVVLTCADVTCSSLSTPDLCNDTIPEDCCLWVKRFKYTDPTNFCVSDQNKCVVRTNAQQGQNCPGGFCCGGEATFNPESGDGWCDDKWFCQVPPDPCEDCSGGVCNGECSCDEPCSCWDCDGVNNPEAKAAPGAGICDPDDNICDFCQREFSDLGRDPEKPFACNNPWIDKSNCGGCCMSNGAWGQTPPSPVDCSTTGFSACSQKGRFLPNEASSYFLTCCIWEFSLGAAKCQPYGTLNCACKTKATRSGFCSKWLKGYMEGNCDFSPYLLDNTYKNYIKSQATQCGEGFCGVNLCTGTGQPMCNVIP